MKNIYLLFTFFLLSLTCTFPAQAHEHATLKGTITDVVSGQRLGNVSVVLMPSGQGTATDAFGNFKLTKITPGEYSVSVSSLSFSSQTITVSLQGAETKELDFKMATNYLMLSEVSISQNNADQNYTMQQINQVDKELRPTNSGQDLLRLVPGLFIAQHAGGGKAEQIFLRGFDIDHGTDFAVSIDGMPVNMVSHAHGQGYADFHFVIPETVDALQVFKGPYNARFGNFATAGAGAFTTKNTLRQSIVKLEAGRFNTYRGLAMIDLLGDRHLFSNSLPENAYIAAEYVYSDAYFESPQHLKRLNLFGKYTGMLSDRTSLSFSGSTFRSSWDASGQIPQRAVESGLITRFGSIDDTEGGSTDRTNANVMLTTALNNEAIITNQVYYSNYHFDLYSNFTFFLNDSINGDGIRQKENGRNIYGYNGTIEKRYDLGGKKLTSVFGMGTRLDRAELGLLRVAQRQILDTIVTGNLHEQNAFIYTDQTLEITENLDLNAGLRYDYFHFNFQDTSNDSLSGKANKNRVSPKLSLFYTVNEDVKLFARSGIGFHSNDARGVVANKTANVLPKAIGYEIGSTFKLGSNILINAAVWSLNLENELVYVGDEAVVEINGPTRRLGTDLAIRYQLTKLLYADADLNYNYGRLVQLAEGENFIPLAPRFTSVGGLTLKQDRGLNASLRYRYIDSRPANEDNSVQAKGYFLLDAVANYTWPKIQIGISAENLLNTKWNEAQFDTESRLRNETEAVSELHFTPGTPFFVKASLSYMF